MATKKKHYDKIQGFYETEEVSEEEANAAVERDKQASTSLADAAEKNKKRAPVTAEEDVTKMSPLQRAAYENKKKKKAQEMKGF